MTYNRDLNLCKLLKLAALICEFCILLTVNPDINIIEELKSCNGKLIYPIFIVGQIDTDYDTRIKKAINYINEYTIPEYSMDIEVSIFFIFLPVINTAKIKEDVVSWIEKKKPLI